VPKKNDPLEGRVVEARERESFGLAVTKTESLLHQYDFGQY